MKDFTPSLACFLLVLGLLCLNCELNFNWDEGTKNGSDSRAQLGHNTVY